MIGLGTIQPFLGSNKKNHVFIRSDNDDVIRTTDNRAWTRRTRSRPFLDDPFTFFCLLQSLRSLLLLLPLLLLLTTAIHSLVYCCCYCSFLSIISRPRKCISRPQLAEVSITQNLALLGTKRTRTTVRGFSRANTKL